MLYKIYILKQSVSNTGIKLHNNLPGYLKILRNIQLFIRKMK